MNIRMYMYIRMYVYVYTYVYTSMHIATYTWKRPGSWYCSLNINWGTTEGTTACLHCPTATLRSGSRLHQHSVHVKDGELWGKGYSHIQVRFTPLWKDLCLNWTAKCCQLWLSSCKRRIRADVDVNHILETSCYIIRIINKIHKIRSENKIWRTPMGD